MFLFASLCLQLSLRFLFSARTQPADFPLLLAATRLLRRPPSRPIAQLLLAPTPRRAMLPSRALGTCPSPAIRQPSLPFARPPACSPSACSPVRPSSGSLVGPFARSPARSSARSPARSLARSLARPFAHPPIRALVCLLFVRPPVLPSAGSLVDPFDRSPARLLGSPSARPPPNRACSALPSFAPPRHACSTRVGACTAYPSPQPDQPFRGAAPLSATTDCPRRACLPPVTRHASTGTALCRRLCCVIASST